MATEFENKERGNDIIAGKNPVTEAIKSGREIDRLLIAHGMNEGWAAPLIAKCAAKGILIKEVSPSRLDYLTGGANHQGIAVMIATQKYYEVSDILEYAEEKGEKPFIIICDEIEDPHNLGAIIRTAEAAGAHGVIIPKRRAVGLTATVYKASAGAVEYVPVARVTNLTDTIKELKKNGIWVYGLDMDGENWCAGDLTGGIAVVVGSEGRGISRLVREQCDGIVSLPMNGNINSLNASVACGIVLYEVARQRAGIRAK